jgi:hypothetical protein
MHRNPHFQPDISLGMRRFLTPCLKTAAHAAASWLLYIDFLSSCSANARRDEDDQANHAKIHTP